MPEIAKFNIKTKEANSKISYTFVFQGNLSPKDCAVACAKRKGCTAFDIGLMSEGQEECAIYGHKET